MLYREIIAICSEIRIKHINTLCGQNAEFVSVKPGTTRNNYHALKLPTQPVTHNSVTLPTETFETRKRLLTHFLAKPRLDVEKKIFNP